MRKYLTCKICGELKNTCMVSTYFEVCYECINTIPEYLEDQQRVNWLKMKIKKIEKGKNEGYNK